MKNKGKIFIFSGLLLMAAALFLTGYNFIEEKRARSFSDEAFAKLAAILPQEPEMEQPLFDANEEIPDYILNPDMEMPIQTVDGIDYIGVLAIPALESELPIISEWSYPNLKVAPCRYSGSAYKDSLVICAHNYVSHFGNLEKLDIGDRITFTDADGNVFKYRVEAMEVLAPSDTEEMEESEYPLTLFTCNITGRLRITVRCSKE